MDSIKIKEETLLDIFDKTIMLDEKPITKVYTVGEHKVTLRSKSTEEFEQILSRIEGPNDNTPLMIYRMNLAMLAFGLVSIDSTNYDVGTLEERIARLNKMPVMKKDILGELLHEFETELDNVRKQFRGFSISLPQKNS